MHKLAYYLLIVSTCFISAFTQASKSSIEIAVQIYGGQQREDLRTIVAEFEKNNPDIDIVLSLHRETGYIENVNNWLHSKSGPDIIYWYGGKRVEHYVNLGLVQDINDFWLKYDLDKQFPITIQDAVKIQNTAYSMPVNFSLVSLYYDKQLLFQTGLSLPRNWTEVIDACRQSRKQGIDLFAVGSKTDWSLHPWFDYLNLRINGLDFHKKLLNGTISFKDNRVVNVFNHWKELLTNDCINDNHSSLDIEQAFPRILRGMSVFTLNTWVPTAIPSSKVYDRLSVTEFPTINPDIPPYTVAPVNGFMVPSHVNIDDKIEKVLLLFSSEAFQSRMNSHVRHLPANINSTPINSPHMNMMHRIIRASPGGIQYFDRNMDIRFSERSPQIFVNFLKHQDIELVTLQLETLRTRIFNQH